mmetsp:Transcript_17447/g.26170  ORF Transcript_17447/g.26170 Transcript_17447/m.26170 type:complete len:107 (-) Transcript_17447:640-960(-)
MILKIGRMKLQLKGNQNFYNVSITLHGLLMIFFLVMPGLFGGFGNYFAPIFQGSPEVVYPKNRFILGLWSWLIFILIHFSLIQSLEEILYSINTYFGFLDIQKFTS